jgi:hypothetical protein
MGDVLDKFTGPRSQLPPAEPGTVWVNKKGPLNEFNKYALSYFDGMPVQDFGDWYGLGRRIVGADTHTRWHERIWPAATTILVNNDGYRFFDKKSGDADTYLDGTAAPNVDNLATNQNDSGRMSLSENMLVFGVGIAIDIPHREYGGFTNNRPNTAAVTGTDTSSATAHLGIIQSNAVFSLIKGSGDGAKVVTSGRLNRFPSDGGISGVHSGNTVEGLARNGEGFMKPLDEVVLLDEERQFALLMKTYTAMLSVLRVPIRAELYGALIRTM